MEFPIFFIICHVALVLLCIFKTWIALSSLTFRYYCFVYLIYVTKILHIPCQQLKNHILVQEIFSPCVINLFYWVLPYNDFNGDAILK